MVNRLQTISNQLLIHAMVVHTAVNSIPIRKLRVGIPVVWVIVSRVVIEVVLHLVLVVVLTTMLRSLTHIRMVRAGVVLLAVH